MTRIPRPRLLAALIVLCLLVSTTDLLAQSGAISAGLDKAATEIKSAFKSFTKIYYAACAIICLVSAMYAYGKWSAADADFKKAVQNWFASLIFATMVIGIIDAVFQ